MFKLFAPDGLNDRILQSLNINSFMLTEQTSTSDEDHVIQLKASEQCGPWVEWTVKLGLKLHSTEELTKILNFF